MYIHTRPFSFPLLTFLRDVDLYFILIDAFVYRLQLGYVQSHVQCNVSHQGFACKSTILHASQHWARLGYPISQEAYCPLQAWYMPEITAIRVTAQESPDADKILRTSSAAESPIQNLRAIGSCQNACHHVVLMDSTVNLA